MSETKRISSALISVFHKDGLDEIVNKLHEEGVRLISTGGTQRFIESLGVPCQPVEELTGYPSILGGRVKTLHPKVFGGILARREEEGDMAQMVSYDIPEIDLVIVDLYPFEDTVKSGASNADIIEKIGADAGLFMHCRTESGWKTVKQMPLPFAHRCDILEAGGRNWVFAASVSRFKENPADWSCKGEIYVIGFDDNGAPKAPQLLYNSLTRNHGMLKCLIDGEDVMCVSGAEGIFGFTLSVDGKWKMDKLFDREVSEFGFIDLDGDGQHELVTIEPFHGNTLNIYKKHGDAWNPLFTDSLSFGHGLSCGMFRGEPIVAVGNRRGTFTLDVFTAKDPANGLFERHQIEQDAGPTQTLVFNSNGVDYILSANQKQNEVVLYY